MRTIFFAFIIFLPTLFSAGQNIEKLAQECAEGDEDACASIVKIAQKDNDWAIRKAATEKISDQSILSEIAKTDPVPDVRATALQKVTGENEIIWIAKNAQG